MTARFPTSSASGSHLQIRNAEQALKRTLMNRDLLDVRKGHCHLAHVNKAVSNPQASISDDVPAHLIVEPNQQIADRELDEKNGQQGWLDYAQRNSCRAEIDQETEGEKENHCEERHTLSNGPADQV